MPLRAFGLTAKTVETLGPGYHADGGKLYLQVSPSGSRSWIFRYQRHARRRDMGLGPYPLVGLADARRLANECRELLFHGIDPLDQKHGQRATQKAAAAKAITFKECAEKYVAAHQAGWSERHARLWEQSLTAHAYPVLGDLTVASIDLPLVLKVLEAIWNTKTDTATRVRSRVESVLDWAATHGYRSGENPARWRGHLENLLPARNKVKPVEQHAALPYPEIGAFIAELRQRQAVGARGLEFCILTAARSGEVRGGQWDEIDLQNRTWTIPGSRMKAGREHRVPLSDRAVEILREMAEIRTSDFVFPGFAGPLDHKTFLRLLERMGGKLTIHGFRSTFRDWAAERTAYPSEIAEMALAHQVGSAVERAYRRSDLFEKRRRLMDDWGRFCASPAAAGEVVAIRSVS
jgi:integrase